MDDAQGSSGGAGKPAGAGRPDDAGRPDGAGRPADANGPTRQPPAWLPAAATALAAGGVAVAGSYAAAGATPAFVAAPVEAALSRAMPGVVVTVAITVLGDLGQQLNLAAAVALAVVLFGAVALGGIAVGRYLDAPFVGPALAGVGVWTVAVLVTGRPLVSVAAAVLAAILLGLVELTTRLQLAGDGAPGGSGQAPGPAQHHASDLTPDPGRRTAVAAVAGALGVGAVAAVVGTARPPTNPIELTESSAAAREETRELLAEADRKSLDVDGLEPLVSTAFYTVDVNAVDPIVDADDWTLSVTGTVDDEVEVTYDELLAMPSAREFVSLRCVGDPLNGRKLDNALWDVVPFVECFDRVGVTLDDDDCCVMLRAADGFYEEFPVGALKRGFLVYGMNGEALPRAHGYPVRALIPGHWGEINVKWLTEVELLDEPADGYWEKRGWHGTGPVNTVAKLSVNADLGANGGGGDTGDGSGRRRLVAGHAYAGTRGVSAVEVSVDGGGTWNDARLSERLPGVDVWRQWAYEYDHPGPHEVVVRAVEDDGTVQPSEAADAYPRGASGWVRERVES